MRPRALGKDFQDEEGAVIHGHAELTLEIALLRRTQCLIENDFAGAVQFGEFTDFVGLAASHEQCRIRRLAFAHETHGRFESGGLRKQSEFFEFAVEMRQAKVHADKNDGAFLAGDRLRQSVSI
jgi:hypothetical protein